MVQEQNAVGLGQAPPPPAAPPDVKLDYIIQQLQRLVEIGEQIIGEVPIVIEPKIVPGLVSVPLDPAILNRAIQAMRLKGKAWFPTTSFAWLCAAGAPTDYTITLPEGLLSTEREGLLSSDFYDPNILVNVYADDERITPYPIQLTREIPMDFGEYFLKRRSVRFETINGTATDALLTWVKVSTIIEKSFYDEFYQPIIEYMYKALEGVAHG